MSPTAQPCSRVPSLRTTHIRGKVHSSTPIETSRTSSRLRVSSPLAGVRSLHSKEGAGSRIWWDRVYLRSRLVQRGSCRDWWLGAASMNRDLREIGIYESLLENLMMTIRTL